MPNKYLSQINIFKVIESWIICLLAVLLLFPVKADAVGLSLGISPPIIQIETVAPAVIKTPITIANLGEETLDLQILLKPFEASEKPNGEISYLLDNQMQGANPQILKRVQIFEDNQSINSVTLAPNQQKKLTLLIDLPKDEPSSDYYFSVVFLSNPAESQTEDKLNKSITVGGVATNILLSIGPKGKAEGEIEEFSAPLFLEKGPVPFRVKIKNTGSYFIAPAGAILIKNMFGQIVGKVDILPVNILAHKTRLIPDSLQNPETTPSASFKTQELNNDSPRSIWPETFILGPYTATLTVALSEQGPILTKKAYFVGLPAQTILALIVTILILLLIKNKLKNQKDKI